jgi:aspartate carbamoyltransferase regulatory subunit
MITTPLSKTMAVNAIQNGTVIDHITVGQALKIVNILQLVKHSKSVTLGLNLPSQSLGYKDIIKIEERELSPAEANQIALLSPQTTISIIKEFEVINKFKVSLPSFIESLIVCPNPKCITNFEPILSYFSIKKRYPMITLECKYCRRNFVHEEITFKA